MCGFSLNLPPPPKKKHLFLKISRNFIIFISSCHLKKPKKIIYKQLCSVLVFSFTASSPTLSFFFSLLLDSELLRFYNLFSLHFKDLHTVQSLSIQLNVSTFEQDFVELFRQNHPDLVSNHPAISYAVLLKWNEKVSKTATISAKEKIQSLHKRIKEGMPHRPDLLESLKESRQQVRLWVLFCFLLSFSRTAAWCEFFVFSLWGILLYATGRIPFYDWFFTFMLFWAIIDWLRLCHVNTNNCTCTVN